MLYFLIVLLVFVTAWGQYWYDKAGRQADAIAYMLEEQLDTEE